MKTLKLIISLLLTIFVVSVVLANQWMLETKFSIYYMGYKTPELQVVILFLITTAIGAILTSISMLAGQLKLKYSIRDYKKKINQMEEELSSLRNLPLRENTQLSDNSDAEIIS